MDNEAEWTQLIDPSSGNPYYVNSVTNETVWDQPEGWVDPATLEAGGGGVDPAEVAQWETHFDETSQQTYWYNKGSGETTWDMPTCLAEASAAADPDAGQRPRGRRKSIAMIEALEQNEATAEERNAQIEIAAQAAAAAEFTAKEKGAVAVAAERLVEQVLTEDSALPQEAKQSKRAKMRRRSSITGAAVSKVQAEAAAEEARLAKVHLQKLQQGQRMAALVGEGLVLLQNARKKKKFEKRWIVVEAETISIFPKRGSTKAMSVVLKKALKDLHAPSTELEAHLKAPNEGVDLCYVDRTITALPIVGDDESAAIIAIMVQLEPNSAARAMDSEGNPIQILECEACGTMQGMTNAMRTKLEKQRKKTLPCSKCQTPMALHLAKNMSELKIKIIKCSWCSNPCKYQDGRTSIVCATCKKVVLIKQAEVKGKARESKKRFDPELLKEMRVLSREIRSNESKITNLKQQIRLWKMRLEKKPKVGNKRRGGQRARKAFKPQKM